MQADRGEPLVSAWSGAPPPTVRAITGIKIKLKKEKKDKEKKKKDKKVLPPAVVVCERLGRRDSCCVLPRMCVYIGSCMQAWAFKWGGCWGDRSAWGRHRRKPLTSRRGVRRGSTGRQLLAAHRGRCGGLQAKHSKLLVP